MGIPTVGGEVYFDESYNGNPLVNAFALGITTRNKIFKGRADGPGNPVIYLGAKTGKDGVKGAIMASDIFEDDKNLERPTVQIGDPFKEKLLSTSKIFSILINKNSSRIFSLFHKLRN